MATLTAPQPRVYRSTGLHEPPVIANDIIYGGAAVGDNASGYARPLAAGDPFLGFQEQTVDNPGGAAGDKRARVFPEGYVEVPVTGVTGLGNVGATVYASDDNTFTLTSTSNSPIGKIVDFLSGTTVLVYFQSVHLRSL